jgi:hypothetical protein
MKHQRLLSQKYKTFHGAAQRAAFERGVAPYEFCQGYKARLYAYRVVHDGYSYRVERYLPATKPDTTD